MPLSAFMTSSPLATTACGHSSVVQATSERGNSRFHRCSSSSVDTKTGTLHVPSVAGTAPCPSSSSRFLVRVVWPGFASVPVRRARGPRSFNAKVAAVPSDGVHDPAVSFPLPSAGSLPPYLSIAPLPPPLSVLRRPNEPKSTSLPGRRSGGPRAFRLKVAAVPLGGIRNSVFSSSPSSAVTLPSYLSIAPLPPPSSILRRLNEPESTSLPGRRSGGPRAFNLKVAAVPLGGIRNSVFSPAPSSAVALPPYPTVARFTLPPCGCRGDGPHACILATILAFDASSRNSHAFPP